MPCSCVIARLLLKEGKAKVVRTNTVYDPTAFSAREHLHATIDTWGGYRQFGDWVRLWQMRNGNVLYLSEVEIRNDIAQR